MRIVAESLTLKSPKVVRISQNKGQNTKSNEMLATSDVYANLDFEAMEAVNGRRVQHVNKTGGNFDWLTFTKTIQQYGCIRRDEFDSHSWHKRSYVLSCATSTKISQHSR
eukprot:scaffold823_cov219-Amphora_coffeaeformis.AAC.23